jgi:hypothetical protein
VKIPRAFTATETSRGARLPLGTLCMLNNFDTRDTNRQHSFAGRIIRHAKRSPGSEESTRRWRWRWKRRAAAGGPFCRRKFRELSAQAVSGIDRTRAYAATCLSRNEILPMKLFASPDRISRHTQLLQRTRAAPTSDTRRRLTGAPVSHNSTTAIVRATNPTVSFVRSWLGEWIFFFSHFTIPVCGYA